MMLALSWPSPVAAQDDSGSDAPVPSSEVEPSDEEARSQPPAKSTPARDAEGDVVGIQPSKGHLEPEQIQERIRANIGALRRCYEAGLRQHVGLRSRIVLRFVIGLDGAVTTTDTQVTEVTPTEAGATAEEVARCLAEVFRRMEFPPPRGGTVSVKYPFVFTPKKRTRRPPATKPRRRKRPPRSIRDRVRAEHDAVRQCYEEGLERQPGLRGRVAVSVVIGPDGRVTNAVPRVTRVAPPEAHNVAERLASCVADVLEGIAFAPPDDGTFRLAYSVTFEPTRRSIEILDAPYRKPPGLMLRIDGDDRLGLLAREDGESVLLCQAPCDREVDLSEHPEVFFGGPGFHDSRTYHLKNTAGPLLARVRPRSQASWLSGVGLTSLGSTGIAVGLTTLLVGYADTSPDTQANDESLRVGGGVALGMGAAALVGGVSLLLASETTVEWERDGTIIELGAAGPALRF